MDPDYSFQDVVRCHICETPTPPWHCEICNIHFCKDCQEKHLSDESKEHKVVRFEFRRCIPKCEEHFQKICEHYCEKCGKPVCVHCVSAKHKGHEYVDIVKKLEKQKIVLQKDLQEIIKNIYPKYQEIQSIICVQRANVKENSMKLATAINKYGEDLHREIDTAITKLKSDVDEMESNHLVVLSKQDVEVKRIISKITESIAEMKQILNKKDILKMFSYKSLNVEFQKYPPETTIPYLEFKPQINMDRIHQLFSSLAVLSIGTRENAFSTNFPDAQSSQLVSGPRIITEINTCYKGLIRSLSCQTDETIWTCSFNDSMIRQYNLYGGLLKSIQTTSDNCPSDIAVTKYGYLVYTDRNERTVNIVKNGQIETMIRLDDWIPHYICNASDDDLLVVMNNNDLKLTKVVRYSNSTEKQTVQYDKKGKYLYSSSGIKYIKENKNLDICVSDCGANAVVVVNQLGVHRFTYNGPPFTTNEPFSPVGITTDRQSCILTADRNNQCIHIINQDGQFLRYIDNCHLQFPWGLCVDTKDNLFVAELCTGKVKKIQYYM